MKTHKKSKAQLETKAPPLKSDLENPGPIAGPFRAVHLGTRIHFR